MTKILAKYTGIGISKTGRPEAKFSLSETALNALQGLNLGEYELDIKKPRNKRSLNQNALLWELIGNMSMATCGSYADNESIYINILKEAGAKCEFMMCQKEAVERLKEFFRYVLIREDREYNGKEMRVVQAFYGTSKMNTEEMAKVIDTALNYAYKMGIDAGYWKDQFDYINGEIKRG